MSLSNEIFNQGGEISLHLDNYEVRPQQIEMAKAVEETIEAGKNLIIEAGTGVGKTLAYLVPFVIWAKQHGKRVVVSTYTKALQNQLFIKDLPFLKKTLDIDIRFSLCMGADNYLCLRKASKNSSLDLFPGKKRKEQVKYILDWIKDTDTGVITDMQILPDKTVWEHFSRDPELCIGKRCKWWDSCFYRKARIKQSKSDILITNHALLFTNALSGSKMLPEFNAIVFDEAHTLEDIATNRFGQEISKSGLNSLLARIKTFLKNTGEEAGKNEIRLSPQIETLIGNIEREPGLFTRAEQLFGGMEGLIKFDINDFIKHLGVMDTLVDLSCELSSFAAGIRDPERNEQMKAYSAQAEKMAESIDFIFNGNRYDYAYWLDIKRWKRNTNYSFHASPVNISAHMKELFFERISPIILTSATLTGGGNDFSFIKKRLGLLEPLELVLDSPFDYKNNVLIYVPESTVDPARNLSAFREHLKNNILELYETLGGRIFCLFTSYEMLNYISARIVKQRPGIELLKQGDMPRYVLLDLFKRNPSTMLMGTTTFWQGVDVPGEALECVIITKFPFTVPTDPVNAARIEAIKNNGGHPFNEYQLPEAVIMFKQGFGRLVRTKTDRGVVAILDPRVKNRSYGKVFLRSLPECRQSGDINDVSDFFALS
jgi:ATP-dependent DNA helicase DinG